MSSLQPTSVSPALSKVERVRWIRDVMQREADAIQDAAVTASNSAAQAAELICQCQGSVVLTGVGKAGLIAQKLVATFASTGTPSHFLHPSEAIHGDLGRVRGEDIVIAFSNSGRSEEVVRVSEYLSRQASQLIAITATDENPLAQLADLVVVTGKHAEACPHGLAPTSSTSVMLAVGDAIALLTAKLNGFTQEDFAKFHPGGALGRKLTDVDEIMRPLDQCRVVEQTSTIRNAIAASSSRRTGAVMLVDEAGSLAGIFTDSDLAKLIERREEMSLDSAIQQHMTTQPTCIASGQRLSEAVQLLSSRHLSELPVIDDEGRPVGLIDITDLIAAGDIASTSNASAIGDSAATGEQATGIQVTGKQATEEPHVIPFSNDSVSNDSISQQGGSPS